MYALRGLTTFCLAETNVVVASASSPLLPSENWMVRFAGQLMELRNSGRSSLILSFGSYTDSMSR